MQPDTPPRPDAATRALARDLHAARAAARARAEHLATVSHELKTPINGILGILGLLRATDLDAEQLGMVDLMLDAARAQAALVTGLNVMASLDGPGTDALQPDGMDPVGTLASVIGLIRPEAEAKGLALRADLPDHRPRLHGDARAFRQVMTNLLGNAVKFTETGGVTVRARLTPGPGGRTIAVAVEDTGPGIAPSERARVFERHARGANGAGAEGSGLGLAVASGLVALMGGTIALRSEVGAGSCFEVELTFPDAVPDAVRGDAA